jgi:hypothetical protein
MNGAAARHAARLARTLWVAPCTLLGAVAVLPALLAGGARARFVQGVIEVSGPPQETWWTRHLPFEAITLGHLVLARTPQAMDRLRAHERVHVRQAERWGPMFFVAYLAFGAWQALRGRSAYWDHPFEVQARSECAQIDAAVRAGGCAPAAGSSRSSAGSPTAAHRPGARGRPGWPAWPLRRGWR